MAYHSLLGLGLYIWIQLQIKGFQFCSSAQVIFFGRKKKFLFFWPGFSVVEERKQIPVKCGPFIRPIEEEPKICIFFSFSHWKKGQHSLNLAQRPQKREGELSQIVQESDSITLLL